jgi:FKBP-type peptidyl-prolyl cis-trans isomerase FkpA
MAKRAWHAAFLAGVCACLMACGDTGAKNREVQTEDLKVGTGEAVQLGDEVEVHYTGWLDKNGEKGKKFDSSFDHPGQQPFKFVVGTDKVIAGWNRGIVGMAVGGKRRMMIPSDLAYGKRGRGEIPPDADLIFEVELLKIIK